MAIAQKALSNFSKKKLSRFGGGTLVGQKIGLFDSEGSKSYQEQLELCMFNVESRAQRVYTTAPVSEGCPKEECH